MNSSLAKYKLGLLIIGLFTLGMVGLVTMQASAVKQDAATDKAANAAADKLNDYVTNQQVVPDSLVAAGVTTASPAIHYTKLSDTKYKFCIVYKASSSDFDPSAVATSLATGSVLDQGGIDSTDSAVLSVPTSHHKGANCQTVDISIDGFSSSSVCGGTDSLCQGPLGENLNLGSKPTACGEPYDASSEDSVVMAISAGSIQIASPGVQPYALAFTSATKFFDANCQPVSGGDVHVGDTVTVYSAISANGAVVVQESGS